MSNIAGDGRRYYTCLRPRRNRIGLHGSRPISFFLSLSLSKIFGKPNPPGIPKYYCSTARLAINANRTKTAVSIAYRGKYVLKTDNFVIRVIRESG